MRRGPRQRHPKQPAVPNVSGEDASELPLEGQAWIFLCEGGVLGWGDGWSGWKGPAGTKAWRERESDVLEKCL